MNERAAVQKNPYIEKHLKLLLFSAAGPPTAESRAAQEASELDLKSSFKNPGKLDFMKLRTSLSKRIKTHRVLHLRHTELTRFSCPEYIKNSNN